MREYRYEGEGSDPLNIRDLYTVFNNYRMWKYLLGMLVTLNKTELSHYKILEPGCGGGNKLRLLMEFRAQTANCFGFDLSERAVKHAKDISPQTMNFHLASALDIPLKDKTFDLIICSLLFDCFKDTDDIRRISGELRRVIKDDGVLLVVEITELFPKLHTTLGEEFVSDFRFFDRSKNELENILFKDFTIFRRANLFSTTQYKVQDGKGERWIDIADLPFVDKGLDDESVPCGYCLYSFLPN